MENTQAQNTPSQENENSNPDKKDDGKLTITVLDTSADKKVSFKIKMDTKFGKVFKAFGKARNVESSQLKFLFDGQYLNEDQTPKELEMEDGDIINAMQQQVGGALLY